MRKIKVLHVTVMQRLKKAIRNYPNKNLKKALLLRDCNCD